MKNSFGNLKYRFILTAVIGVLLSGLSLPGQYRPGSYRSAVGSPASPARPFSNAARTQKEEIKKARAVESYGKLPIRFEANRGQIASKYDFISRNAGYTMLLAPKESVMVLDLAADSDAGARSREHTGSFTGLERSGIRSNRQTATLRMKFAGSGSTSDMKGLEEQEGRTNYLIGKKSEKWKTGIPSYARVQSENIYPGIDLVYYGNNRQLEYDFIVKPGADPRRIALEFEGAHGLRIEEGDLVLNTQAGEVRQKKPFAYQEVDGERKEVAAKYVTKGRHRASIRVDSYDESRPLVIDPILVYSTFIGGNSYTSGQGIALDSEGCVYITGSTSSTDLPATEGALLTETSEGFSGSFVAKLNPSGTALEYLTYLGGSGFEGASSIALDSDGNAYITGFTGSSDFPVTAGAFQPTLNGSRDAFVAKLNADGSDLVYASYLGGSDSSPEISLSIGENASGIAVDKEGNAYVAGTTISADFPVTTGAFQPLLGGHFDAFVAKIAASGSLAYSTYLGGFGYEDPPQGNNITVDDKGNAYVTGGTTSPDFPITSGAFKTQPSELDAFVSVLNATGSELVYSTYFGGDNWDKGNAITLDGSGNAYIIGNTQSGNFPVVNAIQSHNGGGPLFESDDDGGTWSPLGLPGKWGDMYYLMFSPSSSTILYAGGGSGLFKSTDGGSSWRATGLAGRSAALAIDPGNPSVLYSGADHPVGDSKRDGGLVKSTDGGNTWSSTGLAGGFVKHLVIDPLNPSTVYAVTWEFTRGGPQGVFKSTDAGASWSEINDGLDIIVQGVTRNQAIELGIDHQNPATLYVATLKGVFKSTDGGSQWSLTGLAESTCGLTVDPRNSMILYAILDDEGGERLQSYEDPQGRRNPRRRAGLASVKAGLQWLARSTDGGATWNSPINGLPGPVDVLAIDPQNSSIIYGGTPLGLYKTQDGGGEWSEAGLPSVAGIGLLVIDPNDSAKVMAGSSVLLDDVFVARLNPKGTQLTFSTYIGGINFDWGRGIGLDSEGNIYIAGESHSHDFRLTSDAIDGLFQGGPLYGEAFVLKISRTGALLHSTYLGGDYVEYATGIAVNSAGDAYVVGSTGSTDFPTTNRLQGSQASRSGAFVSRIDFSKETPSGPKIISAWINGKKLIVSGEGFSMNAVILVSGKEQKTQNDPQNPATALIGKKAGKKIKPGQQAMIQVRNPDGTLSEGYMLVKQ